MTLIELYIKILYQTGKPSSSKRSWDISSPLNMSGFLITNKFDILFFRNKMKLVQYIVKGFFNIVLPVVDLGTDINFTVDMYLKYVNVESVQLFRHFYDSQLPAYIIGDHYWIIFIISGKKFFFVWLPNIIKES